MSYSIRVFDSRIHAMSMPGGDIYRWTSRLSREIGVYAAQTAPVAREDWGPGHFPGRLRGSHKSTVGANALGCFARVSNSAPYAKFVHNGTSTPIVAHGPYMKFSINGRTHRKKMVRGQRAQPWLAHAQVVVLARHGIT